MALSLLGVMMVIHVVTFEAHGEGKTHGEDDELLHDVCCCQVRSEMLTELWPGSVSLI